MTFFLQEKIIFGDKLGYGGNKKCNLQRVILEIKEDRRNLNILSKGNIRYNLRNKLVKEMDSQ